MVTRLITKAMTEAGASVLQRWLTEPLPNTAMRHLVTEIYRAMEEAGETAEPRASDHAPVK